jgi:hypothetical protein
MRRMDSTYSLKNGDRADPANEVLFFYDADEIGASVRVRFPRGIKRLTADQLAELGVLCIALAGKVETPRTGKLVDGFGVRRPPFLEPPPQCREVAREIMAVFIAVFKDVARQYKHNVEARIEVEEKLAESLAKLFHRNA